jgi:fermentation-respiration switch protein FrsA (DUF1100 family)
VRAVALLLAALALLLWLAVGMLDRLIFQPTPGVDLRPEALGLAAEELWLRSEDGVRLHAFRVPPQGEPLGLALLFLHGNAGNASHRLPNAALLAGMGLDVLLPDYRGYGLSEGSPDEAGTYADARAALAWLEREAGYPASRVLVFGRSLGGAVAVELARDRGLAGLVLESTFPSVAEVARASLGFGLGPLLRGRFDAAAHIGAVRAPILMLHGDRDRIVPFELGRRLFERAPEPKTFETIHGAGHNDTVEVGGRPYLERLRAFAVEAAARDGDSP